MVDTGTDCGISDAEVGALVHALAIVVGDVVHGFHSDRNHGISCEILCKVKSARHEGAHR